MKGRLTIFCDKMPEIFFNTECNVEDFGKNSQISFVEHRKNGDDKSITIGVSSKKIIILRTPVDKSITSEDEIYVLSNESFRTRHAKIDLENLDLFLMTDGMKISCDNQKISVDLRCCFGNGEVKSNETSMCLRCSIISPESENESLN